MSPKPNIVHIFVDQQRFDTIGALNNPVIKTPNLDRLVRTGTAFTNAYTPSPVCVSARCSMIYGQYPMHTGCYENGRMPTDDRQSLMGALADAGYRTHGIGKCHFTPDGYALRGFQSRERQEELGIRDLAKEPYFQLLKDEGYDYVCEVHGIRGEMYYMPQPSQLPERLHPSAWIGDRSIAFIAEQQETDQPWYLFSSFIHPHPPFTPPNPWHRLYRAGLMPLPNVPEQPEALHTYVNRCQNRYKYRDQGIDRNVLRCMKAYYYACISFVDYQIGRILDALEASGQSENTVILFTGDHGEYLGDYHCFGKRGFHDSAARIPLILSIPGQLDSGQTCDIPVSLVDVAPTLLSVAGTDIATHALDGENLAQLVSGSPTREMVFGQLSYGSANLVTRNQHAKDPDAWRAATSTYMAVSKEWKYFYSAPDNQEYLFDRIGDPHETRNKAGIVFCQDALKKMRQATMDHLRSGDEVAGLCGDHWKEFPAPSFPSDPDTGLLIQDDHIPWIRQTVEGYSD